MKIPDIRKEGDIIAKQEQKFNQMLKQKSNQNRKQSTKKKWHRVHFFMKEKKNNDNIVHNVKEHPELVFSQSKTHYKSIRFTTHPTTNGVENVPLKHNIDPNDTTRISYAVPYKQPRPKKEYQSADKKYRVHSEDLSTINQLKHKKSR